MKNFVFKLTLLFVFVSIFAPSAWGWGQMGHDIVAAIAEKHLNRRTERQVKELLAGKSMVYWANWLDGASYTPEYSYTKTWHYKNIDAGMTYETMPKEPKGDVVTAIKGQIQILADDESTFPQRSLALKIIIHLVGDMHQPLHMGHKSDLGGNKWQVTHFNRSTNLHSLWDTPMVENGHKWGYHEWVEQLNRCNKREIKQICWGSIDDWAKETFKITCEIYDTTPQGSKLSYDYHNHWTPVVEAQLLKAGLRLAHLLNDIL